MVTRRRLRATAVSCRFLHVDAAISMSTVNWFWTTRTSHQYQSWIYVHHTQAGCFGLELRKGRASRTAVRQAVGQASFFRLDGNLQSCPKIGLMACCAACSDMSSRTILGLISFFFLNDRPLWQSCSWLIRGVLSLSDHTMHQMPPPFTTLALYALCSSFSPLHSTQLWVLVRVPC